jgi:hypothetical protein
MHSTSRAKLLTLATVVTSGHASAVRLTGKSGSAGRYGGGWRVQITSPQVATLLVGAEHADVGTDGGTNEPAVWACVDREPGQGGKLTDRFEPQIVAGMPDAVARLRPQRALIDQLCLSIPHETEGFTNPEWHEAAGYCVDRLLLAWVELMLDEVAHSQTAPRQAFEELRVACGGVHKAPFFQRRGFVVVDEVGTVSEEGLITHRARLPAAILSYEALTSSDSASRGEREVYQQILRGLRSLPAPGVAGAAEQEVGRGGAGK